MPGLLMLLLTFGLPPASLLGMLWLARFEEGLSREQRVRAPKRAPAPRTSGAKPARAASPRYRVPVAPGAS